jgi:hypothetical protein
MEHMVTEIHLNSGLIFRTTLGNRESNLISQSDRYRGPLRDETET